MSRGGSNDLLLGGEPRVDLMPPEVRAKRQGGSVRRLLTLALVAAVVIVAGGYGFATIKAISASAALTSAQGRTQALLLEQAKYAEVTKVISRSTAITGARTQVTATEVLWKDMIDSVLAVLPAGSTVKSITALGRSIAEPELTPTGPLREPRVAGLTISVLSGSLSDATGWVRRLPDVPAFADLMPTTSVIEGGMYLTTLTLNLNEDALSHRFDPEEDESVESEETEG